MNFSKIISSTVFATSISLVSTIGIGVEKTKAAACPDPSTFTSMDGEEATSWLMDPDHEGGCDGTIAPTLIGQTGHIDSIVADKGYDQIGVYETAQVHLKQGGKIMIHPRANGVVSASGEAALRQRNQHIKSISEDGVLACRRASGYYRQSAVENTKH